MKLSGHMALMAAVIIGAASVGAAFDEADARRREGQRARTTTITGQHGGQRTIDTQRAWDRSAGTRSRDRTTTFNDGSTRNVGVDSVRTGQGQYSVSREVTGRNGETRTQTGDFSVTRTENGQSVSGDINTTHAGQIDYNRDVAHENGVRSVNSSAVFEDGSAITRSSQGSCANGACTSVGSVTGRGGNTATWDQTRTRTETGATLSRDVTFADGTTRSVDAERTGNGDGTGVITRTVTDRAGETHEQELTYETSRTP